MIKTTIAATSITLASVFGVANYQSNEDISAKMIGNSTLQEVVSQRSGHNAVTTAEVMGILLSGFVAAGTVGYWQRSREDQFPSNSL